MEKIGNDSLIHEHKDEIQVIFQKSTHLLISRILDINNLNKLSVRPHCRFMRRVLAACYVSWKLLAFMKTDNCRLKLFTPFSF